MRDVVTHHRGVMNVAWEEPGSGSVIPRTGLYRSSGLVEEDVFGALQKITAGWFAFLNEAWSHFVPRLTEVGVLRTLSVNKVEKTRFFDIDELRGLWVYPVL